MTQTLEFPCYFFSPARHRADRARLGLPLRPLPEWSLRDAGYLPLASGGRLFLTFTHGEVAAYDERTAERLWSHPLPGPFVSIASEDGSILLAGDRLLVYFGRELVALDPATGEVADRRPAPELRLQGAVADGDLLVAPAWDESAWVAALDLASGETVWRRPVAPGNMFLTAAEGVVCYRERQDQLAAADLRSGEERWRRSVSDLGRHLDVLGDEKGGAVAGVPVAAEGRLIVPVAGHHVLALDLATGAEQWVRHLQAQNPASLALHPDGRIYVAGDDFLHVLDARSGEEVSRIGIAAELKRHESAGPFTHLGITEEHVYCGDFFGSVIALHRERGTLDWSFRCRSRIPSGNAPLPLGRRLYVVDGKGNLYAFESAGGAE